ncbi:hypothetical protein TWF569_000817 [Orbilia oligospora]|uniref:UspA domain-containing protein n=1 Tax=Orbilia oligospora TaxID=2813651 RepID=A0A7C8JWJ6_ORBOL|nr:hypothetical protein TWF703_000992 [Orbilia oligospora]KAF3125542.1 hypothetical protein TWF569_000817 [Orbilia oligospora]
MSLESALEEERLEILKLLERPSVPHKHSGGGNSPGISPTIPRSPPLVPRATSPARSPSRATQSISGISSMIIAAERGSNSASPPPGQFAYSQRSRDSSPHGSLHSATSPAYGGPRLLKDRDRDRDASAFTPNADYQFNILPSTPNPHFRRAGGGGRAGKTPPIPSSPTSSPTTMHTSLSQGHQDTLSSIYSESGPFQPGGMGLPSGSQVGGRQIRLGSSSRRSGSPSMYHNRSASPHAGNLSLSPLSSPPLNMNMVPPTRTLITENDTLIDLESAYRRLSDDALRNSGGSLATLPERGGTAGNLRASSGESISRDGGVRLEKDLTFMVGDDGREIAVESTDDSEYSSDDDTESFRGRRSEKQPLGAVADSLQQSRLITTLHNSSKNPHRQSQKSTIPQRKTMSLLAAAEEERKRSYLVATDLSAEAAHALEWTIGTVLRDGDKLLAIYAIDEETIGDFDAQRVASQTAESQYASASPPLPARRRSLEKGRTKSGSSPVRSSSLNRSDVPDNPGEGNQYSSNNSSRDALPSIPAELLDNEDEKAPATSINSRDKSKSEQERWAAAEQISTLVAKLLKKTKLQVNVIVEVIHCKSPKHLLTEMIDILEPTLVILGSRGRSALKGVLLGSFSNYLVTKSSVPVMVARKKLKKSKYKNPNPRLINNLSAGSSRTLASAKVD